MISKTPNKVHELATYLNETAKSIEEIDMKDCYI